MRAILAFGPLLALTIACSAGAGQGDEPRSGERANRDFPVAAFERINLAGSHDVIVTVGGAPSVRAEGDAEDLDRLEITVENGELRIANRERSWSFFGSHHGVTVHVTVPALTGAAINGSGDMRVDRVEGARFAGAIAGSGELEVANLRVADASLSITGSGDIRATGAAQRATVSVTGSGDLDLRALEAGDATIALAGSGDIAIRATGTAQVAVHGSGDVTVAGPARCTISKSGSGDVHCGN